MKFSSWLLNKACTEKELDILKKADFSSYPGLDWWLEKLSKHHNKPQLL